MSFANTEARYGSVAMILHWLIALAIVTNICFGVYVAEILSDSDPARFASLQFHKSLGLTVLVLSLARLAWRLVNPVPPLPASMSPRLKTAAHTTHYLLYFLMIFVPLAGWAQVSASPLGLPTVYFGLFHWPHLPIISELPRAQKIPLKHAFNAIHAVLAYGLTALIPLHVGAAFYHQFRGDDVLRRMLPGTRVVEHA